MRCHPSPLTPPLALEMLNKATRFCFQATHRGATQIRPQETPISAADAISDSLGPSPASARCGLADGIHQQVVPLGRSVREPLPLQAGASKSIPGDDGTRAATCPHHVRRRRALDSNRKGPMSCRRMLGPESLDGHWTAPSQAGPFACVNGRAKLARANRLPFPRAPGPPPSPRHA
ncbi:hypothetical protein ACCO45_008374 [Purpureocillium lilacinum]|uniref:Uncharacterized protein n=1 Tax=Purpureocillium lilacinum TaxID=33203 RepID=A0ACC4DN43_PURLI